MSNYTFHREPRPHQLDALRRSAGKENFALLMEPRTGKTKVVADTLAWRYRRGDVDAALIVAMPSGAPRQWVETVNGGPSALAEDLPPDLDWRGLAWHAGRAGTKAFQRELEAVRTHRGLAAIGVNGEALLSRRFQEWLPTFLAGRRVFLVADETSLLCKEPSASRTKLLHKLARHPSVKLRRILDGTPVGNGPLDLWAQFGVLDPAILGRSFYAFKHRYALWETGYAPGGREFEQLQKDDDGQPRYAHLDELYERIAPHTYRCRFRDVFTAPAKVYAPPVEVELTPEQAAAYAAVRDRGEAELAALGRVTVTHVLTRYLRLQQVLSNYWPPEVVGAPCSDCDGAGGDCRRCDGLGVVLEDRPLARIDAKRNPRLEALEEVVLRRTSDPVVVWCRFDQEVADVLALGERLGRSPVRYDGKCTPAEKDAAKAALQGGRSGLLVGKARAAGRALRLDRARSMAYYSNSFSLLDRLQSEERCEDAEQTAGTVIYDLTTPGTVDEEIVAALRGKRRVSDVVLRERSGRWL